ncbi:MAG: DUF2080 family transposase-associated protein [Nanoarchaeota archaeon]|nr:DUF2080 family transposase-associated protein [Nanoarchaeota archaeon]
MRKFEYKENEFSVKSKVDFFFEKKITKFGNGAKIDAPKEFIGRRVIILVEKKRTSKSK